MLDWDGTLLDSSEKIILCMQKAAEKLVLPVIGSIDAVTQRPLTSLVKTASFVPSPLISNNFWKLLDHSSRKIPFLKASYSISSWFILSISVSWSNIPFSRFIKNLLKDKFSELFEKIYGSVIESVQNIEEYEKHGTLAESLTHYLFTEMLIPSQRKITFKNIELDMIIPNTEELQKNSHNTIIIFFSRHH